VAVAQFVIEITWCRGRVHRWWNSRGIQD